ncbi:unnamed protein product [Sphagnum jensenii]|uniref:Putative gamma-glutamylcyclotransferase n=1 Tax=Sphagnum jensenii TaxID=128206 RepID=A0ABP0XCI5_9BRYO
MASIMANMVVRNVFVYGTLLAPEVVSVLIIVLPHLLRLWFMTRSEEMVLRMYQFATNDLDRIYPAVPPVKGDKVYGKVLFELTEWELEVSDMFQHIEYMRMVTTPILLVLP